MRRIFCLLVVLIPGHVTLLAAQQPVRLGSELESYVRALQLRGTVPQTGFTIRSLSSHRTAGFVTDSTHPWDARYDLTPPAEETRRQRRLRLNAIDPEFTVVYNSAYPRRVNDEAVWAGKGATASVSGGLEVRWGPVSATLLPTLYYSQNRDFPTVPATYPDLSPFAYPWHGGRIDFPQRFGDDVVTEFDWGQTDLRLNLGAFTAGVGTENLWLGPAFRNGIIMSDAGPGFPHIDLGTGRKIWIGIGHLEVRLLYGRLAESDYFDSNPGNDSRFLAAIALDYQPRWLPGLHLGGQRVLYQRWETAGVDDAFGFLGPFFREATVLPNGAKVNDSTDQLASVHARWLLPEAGFEVYVEWARNDFSGSLRDFLLEPDHSSGYTMGFQKLLPSGDADFLLRGELTHLGRLLPIEVRASPTYYVHSSARQGYTHKGQLLGAHIGPGSNSEFLGIDRYDQSGRFGFFVERVRFDDDAYFRYFGAQFTRNGHDVELTAGFSAFRFAGPLDIGASIAISRELNRNFELRPTPTDVTNLNLRVSVGWNVGR